MKEIIRNRNGFTLIELIVVIAIIGVLSSLLVANFMQVREKTRDGVRKKDLEQIRLALESYRVDTGSYPTDINLYGVAGGVACPSPKATLQSGSTVYMQEVPCDPEAKTTYFYDRTSTLTYTLFACLENANDQSGTADTTNCPVASGWGGKKIQVTNP